MKKIIGLAWSIFALALLLALPASAAAASGYSAKIVDQHCISGGHNIYFRVSLTAAGSTPATKLTIKSTSQYLSAGKWHSFYKWAANKSQFSPNGTAHSIDYSYTHQDNSDSRQWRIKSVLKAYNGSQVVYSKTLTSRAC